MTEQPASIFATNWNIYQKIIAHNYMLHREFGEQTSIAFNKLNKSRPLKVLDLGCGDAHKIAEQLKLQPVESYTGYDLSDAALAAAKTNLQPVGCSLHFKQGFLQSFSDVEEGRFDVIYSSYAVHHLQDSQKKKLLQDCFDFLNDKGVVIIIDIMKSETQSREEYITSYTVDIKNNWLVLTTAEKGLIYEHMWESDFPTTIENIASWAMEAGFVVEQSPVFDALHKMIVLRKGVSNYNDEKRLA